MKHITPLILGAFIAANSACAQTPTAGSADIKIGSQTITWVQSVPAAPTPPATKTAPSASGTTGLNGLQARNASAPRSNLDFSSVPKGFVGIGHNAAANVYGFISEEVVVTLQPGAANLLGSLNADCKLIIENARMYVCKATSVPHLQSLMGKLQTMPSVKVAEPQFITQFRKPM
jgi:hypothetical protein